MQLENRLEAFIHLGRTLELLLEMRKPASDSDRQLLERFHEPFSRVVTKAEAHNPWFTQEFIQKSLASLCRNLQEDRLTQWLASYPEILHEPVKVQKRIGVILAGNIPLVGFHDLLCVILSGHAFIGKLSSKDEYLYGFIRDLLVDRDQRFESLIRFEENRLKGFDAVIATGSNNSYRYFEYYFRNHPHILRKNRNAIALLDGQETEADFRELGEDVFRYFGLGCRNVSKVYVPEGFRFDGFFQAVERFSYLYQHTKYANNYDYHRAIFLMNKTPHFDNGFLLVKKEDAIASPIGVLHYAEYDHPDEVQSEIRQQAEEIQCMVSRRGNMPGTFPFGKAQEPELWDYADGVDTMVFLISLG